jgi:hypothetical protein
MKNIHILPTDKPSRLFKDDFGKYFISINIDQEQNHFKPHHIYITSDEEIKEGDWHLNIVTNKISKYNIGLLNPNRSNYKKIILTTDQDLINDGVQAIDDTFLEWFVKNPSCESVGVGYGWIRLTETDNEGYWVSIPDKRFEMQQEEPKQETLEEAAINNWDKINYQYKEGLNPYAHRVGFKEGASWQQEQILQFLYSEITERRPYSSSKMCEEVIKFIEQFKKK